MPHPSEAALIAFADHELDAVTRGEVAAHVDACGACRTALRDLRDAMAALKVEVALVDAAEPAPWHGGASSLSIVGEPSRPLAQRASHAGEATPGAPRQARALARSTDRPASRRAWATTAWVRWAAALLLVVGGGAAAMSAPRWRHLLGDDRTSAANRPPASSGVVAASPLARSGASAAVSVLPVDGEALVSLLDTPAPGGERTDAPGARVVVHVSDRRDVQVTVTSGAGSARVPRFLSSDGKLEVQLAGSGALIEVDFPTTLRSARVTHDGRTVASVRGATILPAEAAAGISLGAER